MTITTAEYNSRKLAFLRKHEDWTVETSPMNEYGQYHKTYACTDGAIFTEINEPAYETVEVETEVKGVKIRIKQEVKLFRTEGWSTDDATSITCYEKF